MQSLSLADYEANYFVPDNYDYSALMADYGFEHVLANAYHTLATLRLAVAEGRNTAENADFQFVAHLQPVFERFGVSMENSFAGASAGTEYEAAKEAAARENEIVYTIPQLVRTAGEAQNAPLGAIESTIAKAQEIASTTGAGAIEAIKQASAELFPEGGLSLSGIGGGSLLLWGGLGLLAFLIFRKRGQNVR
ncbi:MAG: hypothetical protein WC329_04385 [Candidatus Omnitrophota bacterium]|jgi:hypothetical protein